MALASNEELLAMSPLALVEIINTYKINVDSMKLQMEFLRAQLMDVTDILKKTTGVNATTRTECDTQSTMAVNNSAEAGPRFQPRTLPGWAETLVLSDSTYKKVDQRQVGKGVCVHAYSGAQVHDLSETAVAYGKRVQNVIVHAGHNSLDRGKKSVEETISDMKKLVDTVIGAMHPLRILISQIPL